MTNVSRNRNKRVLIFCDWFEPGYKAGGPIQSCKNIINALGHIYEFYILTSDRDLGDKIPYKGISTDQWLEKNTRIRIWYASPGSLNTGSLNKILKGLNPDIVYFNSMFSRLFTLMPLWVLKRKGYSGRIVLAPRGMLLAGAMRQKGMKKQFFIQLFRRSGFAKGICFHATDNQEEKDIRKYFPSAEIILAENIPNLNKTGTHVIGKSKGDLKAIFISRIHPKKNILFLIGLLKKLPAENRVHLSVFGEPDDQEYTAKCRDAALNLPSNIQVEFKGPLPHEEVFAHLKQNHTFLLPTLGENFGHAIFEALSAGLPVVISDLTPWRGLTALKAGWDLPLNNENAFIKAVLHLVEMDQQEYNEWSESATRYAQEFIKSFDSVGKYRVLFQ